MGIWWWRQVLGLENCDKGHLMIGLTGSVYSFSLCLVLLKSMGCMKVVEGDFSGLEILFFPAVRRGGGWEPCYILASSSKQQVAWHGSHLCHHGGSVDGALAGTKGPQIFVSPVLFYRGILSGMWLL